MSVPYSVALQLRSEISLAEAIEDLVALLHFDGVDASTTFTDVMGKTWAKGSGSTAEIDTAQSVFGGASLLCNSSSYPIYTADHDDFYFTGNFSIGMRIRFAALPTAGNTIYPYFQYLSSSSQVQLYISNTAGVYRVGLYAIGGSGAISFSYIITPVIDTWYALELSRAGNNFDIWWDGAKAGTTTVDADTMPDVAAPVIIGRLLNGWLDEFYVTKGSAVHSAAFSVPTLPYTPWRNLISDTQSPISLTRGIPGTLPSDKVADVGMLNFILNNSNKNSFLTLGKYSPDHASVLSNFGLGSRVRLKITYSGTVYYKYYGSISDILPIAGTKSERKTTVQAVDYMDELLSHTMKLLPVQINKKSNELVTSIVGNLPTAPLATSYATGPNIFPYSLHDIKDEQTSGMEAVQKVNMSDLSFTFVKGDLTGGETLTHQTRHTRALNASVATFNDTMQDLRISRKSNKIFTTVKVKGYPGQIGTSDEVLWTSQKEIALAPGASITFDIAYVDPLALGKRVALVFDTGVTPVADTDYKMSSVSGDTGNDLNANLTYTVNTWGGNTANVTLLNGAAVTGYVGICKLRGKIIRLYDPVVITKINTTSQIAYGDKSLTHTAPYQDNVNVLDAFATDMLNKYYVPISDLESLSFVANTSAALMAAAMAIDVGSVITVIETVTGISANFAVNKYGLTIEHGRIICTLENLEKLSAGLATIGVWGPGAGDATYWGPGGAGTIGNWVF